ncbi:hypothetical protein V3C99_018731 [Haemonchus contortus]|uniref:Reverse transcriptase domain-containing protein n=1 Tax=Haemonchus contortus TaxID=6289 RepID=A0A7I4Z0N5_HAECO
MPLCLTFIDLKKAFDTVETEAVIEASWLATRASLFNIVLIAPKIEQAEQALAEFDNACGKIGLRLSLTKTMLMQNGLVPDAPFMLNETNISECSSYVYLGREVNMINDLAPELSTRKRAAWGAEEHPAKRSPFRRSAVRKRIRSFELRRRAKIRDAVDYVKRLKIRWGGHVVRYSDDCWTRAVTDWIPLDVKRTPGRLPLVQIDDQRARTDRAELLWSAKAKVRVLNPPGMSATM